MVKKVIRCFLLLLLCIGLPAGEPENFLQGFPEDRKPKIALVLSGGAALGFAHVGFLKVFEEIGIPVDIVIGNSMGGLVGGLYAAGYSPGDIQRLASTIDWNEIFSLGKPGTGRRMLDSRGTIFTLGFDKEGLANRNGLIADQGLTSLFSRIVYRVSMIRNFSDLPITFKALGVDLLGGGEVPLEAGTLSQAMRASMSIPVVFPPVAEGGHYLIDGGVLNNNPIDLAVKWGADIIIDVNVNPFLPRTREEVGSIMSVFDQTERLILDSSRANSLWGGRADYRLDMDLRDFTKLDFADYQALIDRGEAAAREDLPRLLELAAKIAPARELEPKDWTRRGGYFSLAEPVFQAVRFEGPQKIPQKTLDSFFSDFFGKPADPEKLDQAVRTLRTRWGYETIGYHLEMLEESPEEGAAGTPVYCLVLTGVPVRERNHELALGLDFQISGGTKVYMDGSLWAELLLKDISVPSSLLDLRLAYLITQGPQGVFAYSHPLTHRIFLRGEYAGGFLSTRIAAFQPRGKLWVFGYSHGSLNLLFNVREWLSLELGYLFSWDRYTNINYDVQTQEIRDSVSSSETLHLARLRGSWNSSRSTLLVNRGFLGRFSAAFPFAGRTGGLEAPWYENLEFYHRHYFSPNSSRTFFLDISGASYRGNMETPWTLFAPGGKDGIPGQSIEDFHGRDKLILGFSYLEEIKPLSRLLGYKTHMVFQLRGGNVWKEVRDFGDLLDLNAGLRVGLGVETAVGELFVGPGVSLDGSLQFSLFFN